MRLSPATLDRLPAGVARLRHDLSQRRAGVVHLGLGAFHRAHQAVYLDDLLADGPGWAIVGASLRSPATPEALAPQGGLYTLIERGPEGPRFRVVGALAEALFLGRDRARLEAALAAPETRIVTLTVTEKGYCRDPATGALDLDHPDIRADLAAPERPRSAPGLIVAALAARRRAGRAPFAVLSCDNLPENGAATRRVAVEFAAALDPGLARFIAAEVAFPASMVDRIAPATTEADRADCAAALGLEDAAPVVAEPFTHWVVEDRFPAGRPDLAAAGVELVDDVAPYEKMKLRMLNGAHSTLAYLGYLAGHETIAEAVADPPFRALALRLMQEAAPTVPLAPARLADYAAALIERFANPGLRHRTWQIAMDGTQKLPQRLLATARERIATGAGYDAVALGVAGWMRYAMGRDEAGAPIDLRDPMAERLKRIGAGGDAAAIARGYLAIAEVFGDLGRHPGFAAAVEAHLAALLARGARACVAAAAGRG